VTRSVLGHWTKLSQNTMTGQAAYKCLLRHGKWTLMHVFSVCGAPSDSHRRQAPVSRPQWGQASRRNTLAGPNPNGLRRSPAVRFRHAPYCRFPRQPLLNHRNDEQLRESRQCDWRARLFVGHFSGNNSVSGPIEPPIESREKNEKAKSCVDPMFWPDYGLHGSRPE
jgi:hypothetical protein